MARPLLASLIATAVAAALIYVNALLGFLPQFDFLAEIAHFNARLGLPITENALWTMHAFVGVVIWGVSYALLRPILSGSPIAKGLTFGFITWLAMMTFFMPLAGRKLFAHDLGLVFIVASIVLSLAYGGVLAAATAALEDSRRDR